MLLHTGQRASETKGYCHKYSTQAVTARKRLSERQYALSPRMLMLWASHNVSDTVSNTNTIPL